jgi:catechol 2,3-dioxygenase-like lactoylglutathione lyase family enzyme
MAKVILGDHAAVRVARADKARIRAFYRDVLGCEIVREGDQKNDIEIVAFGVGVLDGPDPHLYFQAPGGQVLRLVGIDEDLSRYEGTEHGERFVGRAFERE